ncbi:MAG: DUF2254 domain-containing protein [Planctomycetaceae bacterium]|nr:DUF2254 domain-containing protein [Planctomycetaceae bacterium]
MMWQGTWLTQLRKYWDRIQSSFWFIPSLMVAGAIGLSMGMIALDESIKDQELDSWWWAYTGSAEGATAVLSTVAGSMITIAGVVFSLTLVSLTLASSQFGPRLLRNFMRDTTNQVVIGTFVSTFLFCLLVLRTIRRDEISPFVPHLSVTLGVVFAVVSVGVLIHFIHHVAISIQADEVIGRVSAELHGGIDRLFPERIGEAGPGERSDADIPADFEQTSQIVASSSDGYLQFVDGDALMAFARREDVLLRVERQPGEYIVRSTPLLRLWPGHKWNEDLANEINRAVVLGPQRTTHQDFEFLIDQLVEIAVRALSPGVNDPFTAISCVDRLGSALSRLAEREIPSAQRYDDEHRLRVIAPPFHFPDVVDAAFHQIRQNARSSAAVSIRLLETLAEIARFVRRPDDILALRHHARMILQASEESLPEREDRQAVERRHAKFLRRLGE